MEVLLYIIVAAIAIFQLSIFIGIMSKIKDFKSIFSGKYELKSFAKQQIGKQEQEQEGEQEQEQEDDEVAIYINYPTKVNLIFKTIADSINKYLWNNGERANDYHLMNDIVERNSEAKEEEIQAQIPTTLYLGLVGTMFGIIIGIAHLFMGDGLSGLLAGDVADTSAIEELLKGVAVAMVASVFGIMFTTFSTFMLKNAKAQNAREKNTFLSWIQANLLPNMSSDVFTALDEMSIALSDFNSQFADNTQKLNDTLSIVAQTAESQAELYDKINQLDISAIAKANVKVYNALQNSTDEITYLAQMLHSSQEYLCEVRQLNENLDKSEQRTKMFEEMGNFFKEEIAAVEERKQMFLNTIDEIDKEHVGQFNKIAGNFENKAENAFEEISEKFTNQNNELHKLAAKQEDIVQNMDLSSLPLKMTKLEEKISRLETFVGNTQGNIIGAISKMKIEQPPQPIQEHVKPEPEVEEKTILLPLIAWIGVMLIGQIVSYNANNSIVHICFNWMFWAGMIGVIVTLVKRKK